MGILNVHNEWDPLEEVIVGTAVGAQVPNGNKGIFHVRYSDPKGIKNIPSGTYPQYIIDETEEDLDMLVDTFIKLGISVYRPLAMNQTKKFSTPNWESDGMSCLCPRDVLLPVGNTIIETPMAHRSRFFEANAYKQILLTYLANGARWISAPKPQLLDECYNTINPNEIALKELEPIFDAANVLRLGRDILYLISDSGNRLGAMWLQNTLGNNYRVHACENLYISTHIDTTLSVLRAGLVLVNPSRVNTMNLPSFFKDWDVIYSPEMVDTGYSGYTYASAWVGMNLLMINPHLAIVCKHQVELIKLLNKHKIDVIPLELRHSRTLNGGFHCVTLDTRRRGVLEDYS